MAATESQFSRVHPGGQRLYTVLDTVDADPSASGYLNALAAELNIGDIVIVHMNSEGANDGVYVLAVDTNNGTTVTTVAA